MKYSPSRPNSTGAYSRYAVTQALVIIEFMLRHANSQVVSEVKMHYMSRCRFLESFSYLEGFAEKGLGVSEKAKELSELMNNPERLDEERSKSQELRKKLGNIGSSESNYGGRTSYNPKYGGFGSNDEYDAYRQSYNEDYSSKKKDIYEKDREISFNKDESKQTQKETKKETKEIVRETHKENSAETKKAIKKMEEDFDFTETLPGQGQNQKKQTTITHQTVNLLDFEPENSQKESASVQPVNINGLNFLDDLGESVPTTKHEPTYQPKKEDSPFNLADALKPESPLKEVLEEEKGKSKKTDNKKLDEFDDFKDADKGKAVIANDSNDMWGKFGDILNIGNLAEPKKAEPKSILITRKEHRLVLIQIILYKTELCIIYICTFYYSIFTPLQNFLSGIALNACLNGSSITANANAISH